jgi:transposase
VKEPMSSQRDLGERDLNLPDYHVIDAVELPLGGRRVIVRAGRSSAAVLSAGISVRLHAWCRQAGQGVRTQAG